MLALYRWLSQYLTFPVRAWLRYRARKGKEDLARIEERFGYASLPRTGRLVWIHAASVGESNSVIPLIRSLLDADSSLSILVTTGTVTSAQTIRGRLPERAFHQFIPVDLPRAVERFLEHWKPVLAIWVESELWPNLILKTHAQGVPMALINARMSGRSLRRWQSFRGDYLSMMQCFSLVTAGSPEDGRRLEELGVKEVRCFGNLKYDAPILPVDKSNHAALKSMIADRPLWLAASTHAGEEEEIVKVHRMVRETFPDLLTMIVPRHPRRADEIVQLLSQQDLSISQRSRQEPVTSQTDCYLADTMGELGLFFELAKTVFIGGSLVPIGGHNPIEPAQFGCSVLCGPHINNFEGICKEMIAEKALVMIRDSEELATQVIALLKHPERQMTLGDAARASVNARRGIVDRLTQELLPIIRSDIS